MPDNPLPYVLPSRSLHRRPEEESEERERPEVPRGEELHRAEAVSTAVHHRARNPETSRHVYEMMDRDGLPIDHQNRLMQLLHRYGSPTVRPSHAPRANVATYNPVANRINAESTSEIIAELAHASQFRGDDRQNPIGLFLRQLGQVVRDEYNHGRGKAYNDNRYTREGNVEYEAHEEIEPRLREEIGFMDDAHIQNLIRQRHSSELQTQ